MIKHSYIPNLNTLKGATALLGLVAALIVGLVLASSAHGAALYQAEKGDITGQVMLGGKGAPDVTVELRKRGNGGEDALLASTKTDGAGTYHFTGQPSAPNDAFYYVRFIAGKDALTAWYSFPIIYIMGSEVSVPAAELGDVALIEPAQDATLQLPAMLRWKARKMGETYRVFIYTAGNTDKPILDSGSLGTGTEFNITEGSLPDGKYEALVQVRDTVVGYGQSQSRFHFSIGAVAQPAPGAPEAMPPSQEIKPEASGDQTEQDTQDTQAANQAPAQPPEASQPQQPDLKLNLSADKTSVRPGESLVYKLEVENRGAGAASGVVITNKLPSGVVAPAASGVKSSTGKVSVDGNTGTITINVESMAPGAKATIEIPVSVKSDAKANLSNQASAQYDGSNSPVQSNAYIAEVAAPLEGSIQGQPASPQGGSAQAPPQQPASSQLQNPNVAPKAGVQAEIQAKAPQAPKQAPEAKKSEAPVPKTGGSFPVMLAVLLLVVIILARYLRGLKYRRV